MDRHLRRGAGDDLELLPSCHDCPGMNRSMVPLIAGVYLKSLWAESKNRGKREPTPEGASSTLPPQVEMGGIEPPSDGGATGLLRVQFASDFLSPGVSREQGRRRAQSPKSPEALDDEGPQQWLPR